MAEIVHNIADLRTLVNRHDQDLYRGNGKPGITTRLQRLEDWMLEYGSDMKWVKRLLVSTLLAVIVDIILRGTGHFK